MLLYSLGYIIYSNCFLKELFSKLHFYAVDCLIKSDTFLGVVKQTNLVVTKNEVRKTYTYHANQDAAGVDFTKKFLYRLEDHVVLVGVSNTFLRGEGVEI